jgi:hypothetical protein
MKKVIAIITLLICTSCTYNEVDENTEIPKEIYDISTSCDFKPDTTFLIKSSNNEHFLFTRNNKTKQLVLVEKYQAHTGFVSMPIVFFIITIFFFIFLGGMITLELKNK